MDHLSTPVAPSAELPLMEGMRLRFASAMQAGASPFALTTLFPGLVHELDNVPKTRDIKLENTKKLFGLVGGPSVPGDVWDMFHSVPRDVLESLVLGTVAFDVNRQKDRLIGLSDDGPGIYVFGLSIANRDGRFLNATELGVLISNLDLYMQGCRRWDEPSGATRQHRQARTSIKFVEKIDSQYGPISSAASPRWISDEKNLEVAEHLRDSLKRRYSRLLKLDPTGTVRMIQSPQSPQYVGCSHNVKVRTADYELGHHKSALTRVNKFLSLTASLLKYQGLKPKVSCVTALQTWQQGQLPKAEMLIAALAGAYATQDGFNIREAGGNTDTAMTTGSWFDCEAYVFAETPHLANNVEWSQEDLQKVKRLREIDRELKCVDDGQMRREAEQADAERDALERGSAVVKARTEAIRQAVVKEAQHLQAETEDIEMLRLGVKAVEYLVNAMNNNSMP